MKTSTAVFLSVLAAFTARAGCNPTGCTSTCEQLPQSVLCWDYPGSTEDLWGFRITVDDHQYTDIPCWIREPDQQKVCPGLDWGYSPPRYYDFAPGATVGICVQAVNMTGDVSANPACITMTNWPTFLYF